MRVGRLRSLARRLCEMGWDVKERLKVTPVSLIPPFECFGTVPTVPTRRRLLVLLLHRPFLAAVTLSLMRARCSITNLDRARKENIARELRFCHDRLPHLGVQSQAP
jgi:hypothetical protein